MDRMIRVPCLGSWTAAEGAVVPKLINPTNVSLLWALTGKSIKEFVLNYQVGAGFKAPKYAVEFEREIASENW